MVADSGTYDDATLQRRYSMAQALMQHQTPIKHWAEGLGNIGESLLGGYQLSKLDDERRADKASGRGELFAALGLPAPASTSPESSQGGFQKIAALLSGGNAGAPAPASANPVAAPDAAPVAPPVAAPMPPVAPQGAPVRLASAGPVTAPVQDAPSPRAPVEPMGDVVRTNPDGTIAGNITAPTIPTPAATKIASALTPTSGPAPATGGLLEGVPAEKKAQIATMLSSRNPVVNALGQAEISKLTTPKTVQSLGEGYIWKNGKVERAYTPEDKTPTSVSEYKFYKENLAPDKTAMDYETWSSKKARDAATNVNTSVDTRAETEQSKAIGKAKGEVQADDIKAGAHAGNKLRQLATLDEANKSGGDDISSGPLGKAILSGKQGLSELTGIDLKGVPESEVIQKVGFGLATNMVKAITNRPSQMEFGKALENVPGLLMSKQGRVAMTSILTQDARAEQELGRLANKHKDIADGPAWQDVKDKYYEEHPLISPFTGKPFGEADVKMLTSQQGAAAAPAAANGPDPSALAEAKLRGLIP